MGSELDRMLERLPPEIRALARKHYTQALLKHWLCPKNLGPLPNPDGHGRLTTDCGDTIEIFLRVRQNIVVEARFLATGCAATVACASAAAEIAQGKPMGQVQDISEADIVERLGDLPEENKHCALHASQAVAKAVRDFALNRNEPWKRLYHRTD